LNDHVERFIHQQIKQKVIKDLKPGAVREKGVFFLNRKTTIKFRTPNVGPLPFFVGTNVKKLSSRDSMTVDILQFNDNKKPTGGMTFQLTGNGLKPKIRKPRYRI
jgi:hypothetical protein